MLETVYIARHGFRMSWSGRELFAPSGRPRDPVLTAHGIDQAKHLAEYFHSLPEDQRPEMIISSPYYRCVQTSLPTAEKLGLKLMIEPGITEWFPPVKPNTGLHPSPSRTSTVISQFPQSPISSSKTWSPLLYASLKGETISELHSRTSKIKDLLMERLEKLAVKRVLIVSHAATIIALGRCFLNEFPHSGDEENGRGYYIGAGTATISKYNRIKNGDGKKLHGTEWEIALNGNANHLPNGVEREWDFNFVPSNVEEEGMGEDWVDEEAPEDVGQDQRGHSTSTTSSSRPSKM